MSAAVAHTSADPRAQAAVPATAPDPASLAPAQTARPPAGAGRTVLGAVIAALLIAGAALAWRRRRRPAHADPDRQSHALELALDEISVQAATLQSRRRELTGAGRGGDLGQARWSREVRLFCQARIVPLLEAEGLARAWPHIEAAVLETIEREASAPPPPSTRPGAAAHDRTPPAAEPPSPDLILPEPPMAQSDYDRRCIALLATAGWNARIIPSGPTRATCVLAERDSHRLVLSCRPGDEAIGDEAIVQAVSARDDCRADFAAIASAAPFTAAACRAAAMKGVFLLHHDDLASFSFTGFTEGLVTALRQSAQGLQQA